MILALSIAMISQQYQYYPVYTKWVPAGPQYSAIVGDGVRNSQALSAINNLTSAVVKLEARIAAASGPVPQPARSQNDEPVLSIFVKSCKKCHSTETANSSGGGFTLLTMQNQIALTDPLDKLRIDDQVYNHFMPKGGELSPDEYTVIRDWIASDRDNINKALRSKK